MSSLETFYWFSWISWNVYIFSISAWHGAVLRHQPLHPNSWKEVEKAGEEVPGGTVSKHTAIQHLCFASLFQPFQLFQLNLKALCGYHWYHWHSHLQFVPAKCHLSWPSTPQIKSQGYPGDGPLWKATRCRLKTRPHLDRALLLHVPTVNIQAQGGSGGLLPCVLLGNIVMVQTTTFTA